VSTKTEQTAEIEQGQPQRTGKRRVGNLIFNLALVVVIVFSALWLPPISLGKRFTEGGYATIGQETWSMADPDGTQFTVLPEGLRGEFKAKLTSVPRSDFLEGKVSEELLPAVESLPSYIDIKSPVYILSTRGEPPTATSLTIPIPNDSQPYQTLDLYTWENGGWSWLPSEVLGTEEVIVAKLDRVPANFVVAQTHLLPPVVSAELTGQDIPAEATGSVVELNPKAFVIGDNGQVVDMYPGDLTAMGGFAVVPVISNQASDGTIRNDLVDNMLIDASLRQAHINAISELVANREFQGVEIAYIAINPALRGPFSGFIAELADKLHQQGKVLDVRVESPRQVSYDQWDTGVFDWMALGRSADTIKVPCIPDPKAYVPDGQMDQLLKWAVSQVHRHKLQILLSTLSIDLKGSNPSFVSYVDAMNPFTDVSTEGGRQTFKAGEQIVFGLSAGEGSTNIMYDEGSQCYWFRYRDERGEEHTVWLQNAANVAYKLRFPALYNLRGVAFQNLFDEGNDAQIWQVVREFHTQTVPNMKDQFAIVWTINDSSGKTVENLTTSLQDPRLVWGAPQSTGKYVIVASLSSDNGNTATVQGELTIQVAQELPTPTPEATEVAEVTVTATPEPTSTPAPTPTEEVKIAKAEPEATVTNNVLNLRAGPGTNYAQVGHVSQNDKLKILGKNPEGTWIKVVAPDGTEAWVILTYVTINVEVGDIPLAEVPPAPTPAPQPTSAPSQPGGSVPAPRGTGFGYGVQAHQDTARVVQALNDIGFGWVKQQVRWAETEGTKGKYGFAGLDNLVDTANAGGIKVLFSIVAAPGWARPGKSGVGPPDNYQDFYDFMGAMAAHFKGRVGAYEIWNEQNLKREWEGAPLSAADYVRLLKGAYQAIKAADPNAIVVSGAPTPTGISDGNWAIDDRQYLQQMYNAGLRYYCDAVGAHPSGYANPPDVLYTGGDFDPKRGFDDHPSFFFRNTMEDYYRIMAASGDGGKRIWATEFGWPTISGMGVGVNPGYEFAADINEQQQADYIVRAYTWSRNWGHAGVMFLWNLNFWPAAGAQNEMAKYGIVRGDWSPRPAYIALKNMPK
jgi:uncharacterized protein YraI